GAGLELVDGVGGGGTREDSVLAGLAALEPHRPQRVLVHDAARPFVTPGLIGRAIATPGAAIPALPVTDTIKLVTDGRVVETLDRARLRAVQTPQVFDYSDLLAAHR